MPTHRSARLSTPRGGLRTKIQTTTSIAAFVALATIATALSAAHAAELPPGIELSYSGPEKRGGAAPSDFMMSAWEPGQTLYVTVADSNLREKADSGAPVLAILPMAAAVKILARVGDNVRVGERVDAWYEVQLVEPVGDVTKGFFFGGSLTPAAHVGNWDDDAEVERLTVAWSPTYKVRIRLQDGASLQQIDLQPGGQAYACCGGRLEVRFLPAASAGVPLVRIDSSVEACGDYAVSLVSYHGGTLREALRTGGLSDPPSYAKPTITFEPKKRVAKVLTESWAESEEGGKVDVERTNERYALREGIYAKVENAAKKP